MKIAFPLAMYFALFGFTIATAQNHIPVVTVETTSGTSVDVFVLQLDDSGIVALVPRTIPFTALTEESRSKLEAEFESSKWVAREIEQLKERMADLEARLNSELEKQPQEATPPVESASFSMVGELTVGSKHSFDLFSITLVSAVVEKPRLKGIVGSSTGKEPELVITFLFENKSDRKILQFDAGNMFTAGHFSVHDDVQNRIRGVDYGLGTISENAMKSGEELQPSESKSHVEVFSLPPPKTEALTLRVNAECFGQDGTVEFKIPVSAIENFGN